MRIVFNQNKQDELSLSLFDNGIEIDRNLPKFKKDKNDYDKESSEEGSIKWNKSSLNVDRETFNVNLFNSNTISTTTAIADLRVEKKSILDIIKEIFSKKEKGIPNIPVNIPIPPRPPITNVFKMIISSSEELDVMKGKAEKLRTLIEKAKENGQIALAEKIKGTAEITFQEEQLIINKFKKVISEKQMINFVKGYEKELSLSYITNYVRHIPDEVIEKKKVADVLEIFDNYIILNYDPENTSSVMTEEEVKAELERKRDPILFGLIKGSRKFYFIGDWKDEYCDLTIDNFIDKYSEESITLKEQL